MNKIVFTNGVFDILHRGHIELLKFCKEQGDYLVVAIDSDKRVKETKGKERPINSENERKFILESIRFVDEVIIFDSIHELRNLHSKIKPNIVVKGSDWNLEYILQNDGICPETELIAYPLLNGYSTTFTINKMKEHSCL